MASNRERQSIHDSYLKIIAGEKSGFLSAISRFFLSGLGFIYGAVISVRNWAYDRQILKSHQLPIPVISVGNLTAGGTGKTPIVHFLAQWLKSLGYRPAIVMRGYGAGADLSKSHLVADELGSRLSMKEAGDEATQLAQNLPGVPVWIGADRYQSGLEAIRVNRADILIMDDGFQHRKLVRDMDIVVVDALQPWGYGHVLPRGLMREQMSGLKRANGVLITRSDMVSSAELDRLTSQIQKYSPEIPIIRTIHEAKRIIDLTGKEVGSLGEFAGKKVHLFCGLGNPQGFFQTARKSGFSVIGQTAFPDHHSYKESEIESLSFEAQGEGAEALLTTEKDGVKLKNFKKKVLPIWQLTIEVSLGNDEESLKNGIMKKCKLKELNGEK